MCARSTSRRSSRRRQSRMPALVRPDLSVVTATSWTVASAWPRTYEARRSRYLVGGCPRRLAGIPETGDHPSHLPQRVTFLLGLAADELLERGPTRQRTRPTGHGSPSLTPGVRSIGREGPAVDHPLQPVSLQLCPRPRGARNRQVVVILPHHPPGLAAYRRRWQTVTVYAVTNNLTATQASPARLADWIRATGASRRCTRRTGSPRARVYAGPVPVGGQHPYLLGSVAALGIVGRRGLGGLRQGPST